MWYVWVFLGPLCPVCQDYTFYLNQLDLEWSANFNEQVEVTGWFPDPNVTDASIAVFEERYDVDWALARDTVGWSAWLEADWTPEVFVLDSLGTVRYRGRINDLYFALGKHRLQPRSHDLGDAVAALLAGLVPENVQTDVIGCPIERRYPIQPEGVLQRFPHAGSVN